MWSCNRTSVADFHKAENTSTRSLRTNLPLASSWLIEKIQSSNSKPIHKYACAYKKTRQEVGGVERKRVNVNSCSCEVKQSHHLDGDNL